MKKILNLNRAKILVNQINNEAKSIVLAGGCFDILHLGHIKFLEAAKKQGEILLVALESDRNVKKLKGPNRPINPQKYRARILAALTMVDYVILLPPMPTHQDYFSLVQTIKPDVTAVTAGDPHLKEKIQQAKMVGGKVKIVIPYLKTISTTKLAKILGID